MADPLSVVSIVEGSIALVIQCGSVTKKLSEFAQTFKRAKLAIQSIIVELDTMELAWKAIQVWVQDYAAETSSESSEILDKKFLDRLHRSLECGVLVMSALQDDLVAFTTKLGNFGVVQRAKATWNEKALKDHQERIRGQAAATSLLLQVIKLPSPVHREQLLKSQLHRFRKYDESASSIVPSHRSSKFSSVSGSYNGRRSTRVSMDSLDMIYRHLSFEDDLYNARVYRRNYKHLFVRSFMRSKSPIEIQESLARDDGFQRGYRPSDRGSLSMTKEKIEQPDTVAIASSSESCDDISRKRGISNLRTQMERITSNLPIHSPAFTIDNSVRANRVDTVKSFLLSGQDAPLRQELFTQSPLHIAAHKGDTAMTQALLESGADVFATTRKGLQPVDLAIAGGSVAIVRLLIDAGATLKHRIDLEQQPLHCAARLAEQGEMFRLVIANGADINAKDSRGRTALQISCLHCHRTNVRSLLSLGASLSSNTAEESPVNIGIRLRDTGILSELLEHNPDSCCSVTGMTIPMALISESNRIGEYEIGILKMCGILGSQFDARDYTGNHVLHHWTYRARKSNWSGNPAPEERMLDYILDQGANLNVINSHGETPLSLASKHYRIWLVLLLQAKGAKPLLEGFHIET